MDGRAVEPLTTNHLEHLAEMARVDRESLFSRRPARATLRDRIICVALCQGGALHWADRKNGVKDLDVFTFYSRGEMPDYSPRRRTEGVYDKSGLTGWSERVDMMGRSIDQAPGEDGVVSLLRYLGLKPTGTAWHLAQKAVVLIEPRPRIGNLIWLRGAAVL